MTDGQSTTVKPVFRGPILVIMLGLLAWGAWIVTGAVLITGLIDRESGLAAALLAVALFSSHLLGLFVSQMLSSQEAAT